MLGNTDECAKGATVTLTGNDKKLIAKPDFFGDFESENLTINEEYTIKIEAKSNKSREIKTKTKTGIYPGTTRL